MPQEQSVVVRAMCLVGWHAWVYRTPEITSLEIRFPQYCSRCDATRTAVMPRTPEDAPVEKAR